MFSRSTLLFVVATAAAASSGVFVHGQDAPFPVCYVCGDESLAVTLPDVMVSIPTQEPIMCSVVEQGGLNGQIDPQFCPVLTNFVAGPCGCEEVMDTISDVPIPDTLPVEEDGSAVPSDMPSLMPSIGPSGDMMGTGTPSMMATPSAAPVDDGATDAPSAASARNVVVAATAAAATAGAVFMM